VAFVDAHTGGRCAGRGVGGRRHRSGEWRARGLLGCELDCDETECDAEQAKTGHKSVRG